MVAKTTNRDVTVAVLLKQCRKDGGPGYVGKIVRTKGQDERVTAIVLADQEWAHAALMARRGEVARYLRVDNVQIQKRIEDPLIAAGVGLRGAKGEPPCGFVIVRR